MNQALYAHMNNKRKRKKKKKKSLLEVLGEALVFLINHIDAVPF
jgi:hypothetical protein